MRHGGHPGREDLDRDPEPAQGREPVPNGKYKVQIVASEMCPTKDGNGQYLRTEMESGNPSNVLDGDIDAFIEAGIRWRRQQETVDAT